MAVMAIVQTTAIFIGQILASATVIGAFATAQQFLSGHVKDIGKTIIAMCVQLFRSFANRSI